MNLNDFIAFMSGKTQAEIDQIVKLTNKLGEIEHERAEIITALERLGFEDKSPLYSGPPIRAADLCVMCSEPATMTVDGSRFCETHGDLASAPAAR